MDGDRFNKAVVIDAKIRGLAAEIVELEKYLKPETIYSVKIVTTQASGKSDRQFTDRATIDRFGNELLSGMIERKKAELAQLEHQFKIL